jgi:hypothetical protein
MVLDNIPLLYSEVTYLELKINPHVGPAQLDQYDLQLIQKPELAEYIHIYKEIGRHYLWNYRPGQADDEIIKIIRSPLTSIYFLYCQRQIVGMAELFEAEPKDIELVHFGLVSKMHDKGIGRKFLQQIMHIVWNGSVDRMWLSTCGLDHPKALPFYEAAGFEQFKRKIGQFKDWRFTGFYNMSDAPQIPYGKKQGDA